MTRIFAFTTASTVCVKVYGDSYWSNDYTDLGRKVFSKINSNLADAVSFIVP